MEVSYAKKRDYKQLKSKSGDDYSLSSILFRSSDFFVHQEKLAPGKYASAPHVHKKTDECVYILSGLLEVICGEKKVVLGPGDSVLFEKSGEFFHQFYNKSNVTTEFLVITRNIQRDNDVEYKVI